MATLSVKGLYNWDATLLDPIKGFLPNDIDWGAVKFSILAELCELEFLYANPDVAKALIHIWAMKESPMWAKLQATVTAEYNPIENYDRNEDYTDTTHGETDSNTDGSNESRVSAFNSDTYEPRERATAHGEGHSESDGSTRRVGRVHGNVGVTTTQTMLKEEREVVQFNLIDFIVQSFKERFCLMVY